MQYKLKLEELELEKKKRIEADQKREDLEQNLLQMIDDNEKTREELQTCIQDNSVLSKHF